MKKLIKYILSIAILIVLIFLSGPRKNFGKLDNTPSSQSYTMDGVAETVRSREEQIPSIKTNNASHFIWADSITPTEYSLVYLHGYSASHGEAQPILQDLSERYNCNIYLPRLYQHGLNDVDAFKDFDPVAYLNSAKDAIAIGKAIGKKLIVMSTSTGTTLASYLAANDPDIEALICTSPNFDLYDEKSKLLTMPWGKALLKKITGSEYREWNTNSEAQQYWTTKNHIDGLIALRYLLNHTMTPAVFKAINQPVYIAYYYRDEENMDKTISISAIHQFKNLISTPEDQLMIEAFANARGHVISSKYMNPNWKDVEDSIFRFCENKIGMKSVGVTQPSGLSTYD